MQVLWVNLLLFLCLSVCVSESIYKGISPGGVYVSLQWRESKGGGTQLVHSWCRKQPTSLKILPFLAVRGTVHYLFIYLGWGQMYV